MTQLKWTKTPEGNYKAGVFTIVKQDQKPAASYPYVLFQWPFSAPRYCGNLDECKWHADEINTELMLGLVS